MRLLFLWTYKTSSQIFDAGKILCSQFFRESRQPDKLSPICTLRNILVWPGVQPVTTPSPPRYPGPGENSSMAIIIIYLCILYISALFCEWRRFFGLGVPWCLMFFRQGKKVWNAIIAFTLYRRWNCIASLDYKYCFLLEFLYAVWLQWRTWRESQYLYLECVS